MATTTNRSSSLKGTRFDKTKNFAANNQKYKLETFFTTMNGVKQEGVFAKFPIEEGEVLGWVEGHWFSRFIVRSQQQERANQTGADNEPSIPSKMWAMQHASPVMKNLEFVFDLGCIFSYVNNYEGFAKGPNVEFVSETTTATTIAATTTTTAMTTTTSTTSTTTTAFTTTTTSTNSTNSTTSTTSATSTTCRPFIATYAIRSTASLVKE